MSVELFDNLSNAVSIFEQKAHARLDIAIADASKFIADENEYYISTLVSFKQKLILANLWGWVSLIKKRNERLPATGPFSNLTLDPNFLTDKKEPSKKNVANASSIGLFYSSGPSQLFFPSNFSGDSRPSFKVDSNSSPPSVLIFNGTLTCTKSMLRFNSAFKPLSLEPQSLPLFQQAPNLEHAQTAFLGIESGIAERSYFTALSKITPLTIFMDKS